MTTTMTKITIHYRLTCAAQRVLVLAGTPVPIEQSIEVELPLAEALDADAIEILGDGSTRQTARGGHLIDRRYHICGETIQADAWATREAGLLSYDHVLSADEALAEWRGLPGRYAAARAAVEPALAALRQLHARSAEEKAAIERQKSSAAAAAAVAAAERDAWIAEHGSQRLRLAAQADLLDECAAVYREERLQLDRPGWRLDSSPGCDESEIYNPSEQDLAALIAARADYPDSQIDLCRVRPAEASEYDDEWDTALKSEYLDRLIYRAI